MLSLPALRGGQEAGPQPESSDEAEGLDLTGDGGVKKFLLRPGVCRHAGYAMSDTDAAGGGARLEQSTALRGR
eukprot:1558834-Rhodomonas_salina.4